MVMPNWAMDGPFDRATQDHRSPSPRKHAELKRHQAISSPQTTKPTREAKGEHLISFLEDPKGASKSHLASSIATRNNRMGYLNHRLKESSLMKQ
ncbi:hypothetical protein YC2023_024623 [Brassica napus]